MVNEIKKDFSKSSVKLCVFSVVLCVTFQKEVTQRFTEKAQRRTELYFTVNSVREIPNHIFNSL
jgi:hypothetical protein